MNTLPSLSVRPNGKLVVPIAGTIRWINGENTGLWGQDHEVTLMLLTKDGVVRALNAFERIVFAEDIARLR